MITVKPINLTEADVARFWSKVDKRGPNDCWEWAGGRDKDGYGQFYDCTYSPYRANRIAFVITNGDTKLQVCHTCNNPPCCNPAHLYAGTQLDNVKQAIRENRLDSRGEKHGLAKLTESDVREIRALYVDGWLQREIAEVFGIVQQQVSHICRGKRWKHI